MHARTKVECSLYIYEQQHHNNNHTYIHRWHRCHRCILTRSKCILHFTSPSRTSKINQPTNQPRKKGFTTEAHCHASSLYDTDRVNLHLDHLPIICIYSVRSCHVNIHCCVATYNTRSDALLFQFPSLLIQGQLCLHTYYNSELDVLSL